jgi:transposase
MISFEITKQDKEQFNYERFNHYHPRVQQRMEILWLKSLGLSHEMICMIGDVSPNTMRTYLKDFQKGGIEKLKKVNFYRPESKMKNHSLEIKDYFQVNPPQTLNEARFIIEKLTGIKRSLPQIRKFILDLGMSIRKVGSIPGKALTEEKKTSKSGSLKNNSEQE